LKIPLVFKNEFLKNELMNQETLKQAVGYKAAELIQEGMLVGLGTGSTVYYFIQKLIERVAEGLKIQAVSSSLHSAELALKGGIPMADINKLPYLDITVDGADEIDGEKRIIKGGGGALLREKILASMSREMIVVVDESKLSPHLGQKKLPVEIIPFAHMVTFRKIEKLGNVACFRKAKDNSLYLTDNGNYIVDITFSDPLIHPEIVDLALREIPGVVETGFFFHLAGRVIVGFRDGQVVIKP
jgi:ribose 5-phosphate isomerase A